MSADVQPRKRKDKKKKRDDEEIKESHHGVHATKMGADDVHLHVQSDHSTGGNWFAKVFFFSLLAILLGLIGLIIIENRGLSDLDTPLSESRFSEYFEGWVDEHRQSHDDHAEKLAAELENHDAEPFEEEEDHSEGEDDEEHDDSHPEQEDHDDEKAGDEGIEEEDDAEETVEDEENDDDNEDEVQQETGNDDGEDEDEVEEDTARSYNNNLYMRAKRETKSDDEDDADEGFDENEDIDNNNEDNVNNDEIEKEQSSPQPAPSKSVYEQDPYEEIIEATNACILKKQIDELYDIYHEVANALNANMTKILDNLDLNRNKKAVDDDDFDSLENVVYNDADEDLHLQRKAEREQEVSPTVEEQEPEPESSSQIKSRPGGGPQSFSEDDYIEEQLRRANEEMLQNNFQAALKIFEVLSLKYPDVPGALYGKAKALDRLSEEHLSNQILAESIMAYKRFLALEEKIDNFLFKEAAERCIDRMRFRGLHLQAIPIHQKLIDRFSKDPYYRNQLVVTLLLLNRCKESFGGHLTSVA